MKTHFCWIAIALMLAWFSSGCRESVSTSVEIIETGLSAPISLRALAFSHPDTGVAVGGYRYESTVILRTVDGGATWEPEQTAGPVDRVMYSAYAEPSGFFLAGGNHDQVLIWNSSAEEWRPHFMFWGYLWSQVRAITRRDDSTLMAVAGGGYDRGLLVSSRDQGRSWQLVDSFEYELRDIHFVNDQTGLMAGFGTVFKTTDGGETWEFTTAEGDIFVSLDFPTASTGYVAGRAGTILKTTDAGATWEILRNGNSLTKPRHRYSRLRFWDSELGYVVGDEGRMLMTENGGQSWQPISLPFENDLFDLYLRGEREGLLVGSDGLLAYVTW